MTFPNNKQFDEAKTKMEEAMKLIGENSLWVSII
jgi:hypothetical protein